MNNKEVRVYEGASADIQNTRGISKLTIYLSGATQVITGNDFSATTLVLNDLDAGEVIDLSGNYWGTANKEEIIAKIQNYDAEHVILDHWIVGQPEEDFVVQSLVGDTLASADTRSMMVQFSHKLDESTIAGNVYLENLMGERVEVTSWSHDHGTLTLHFDALPTDGKYHVVLDAGLANEHGKSLRVEEGATDCRLEFMADITAESVESIRLPQSDAPGYIDVMLDGAVDGSTPDAAGFLLVAPGGATVEITGVEMYTDCIIRVHVAGLPEVGEYALTLPATLTDAAGNRVVQAGTPVSFTVESADVTIEDTVGSYSGLTNGSVEVAFQVQNVGNAAAEGTEVEIWLTTDGTAEAVLLDSFALEMLAAGGTAEVLHTLNLNNVPGLLAGHYTLVAKVSGGESLAVLSANNAGSIGSLELAYPPAADLKPALAGGISALSPGQTLDVICSLSNIGTVDADSIGTVRIGIIPAGGTMADMVQIGVWDMSDATLSAGSAESFAITCTVPGDIKLGGSVQMVAVLESAVYEQPGTTENNVFVSEVLQLEKCLSISTSVDSVTEGSSTRVVYTITRTGDCSEALVVQLSSEQAARLSLPETVTIAAGQSSARYQARVVNDAEYTGNAETTISVSAEGYMGSSTNLTITDDEKPTITVQLVPATVTEGADTMLSGTISIDTISTTDTIIKLGSNLSGQISVPAEVIIKAGESSASFEAKVVDDSTAEIDKEVKITAASTGFNSGTATVKVADDDLPQVELVLSKEIVSESDGYYALTASLVRTGGSTEAITVKLQDADGIGLILPASIPMGAGVTRVNFTIGVVDDALANGERTGTIRGTITIDDCGCDASSSSNGGVFESTLTVQDNDSPALTVSLSKSVLREGGQEVAVLTVTSNYVSDAPVVVTLSDGGLLNLPATLTIPAGSTTVSCEVTAKADGVSDGTQYTTILATAEGYISGRGYMQVTDMDVADLVVDSITPDGAAISGKTVQVSVLVRNQGYAATSGTAAVEIRLSDGTVLGTVRTGSALAAGESTTLTTTVTLPQVSGQYTLVAEADKANQYAELEETNNTKVSSAFTIGSGYSVTANIAQEVLYAAGTINLSGQLTATAEGLDVAGQTVNLYLYYNGSQLKKLTVTTAEDGSYSTEYTIPTGLAGNITVKAGVLSEMSDTLDAVPVAGLRLNTSARDLQWLLEKGSSKSGTISVTNNGAVDLHNVQLLPEGLPENVSFTIDTPAMDLAAGQTVQFRYTITGNELNVGDLYSSISLKVQSDEGTSLDVPAYSYVMNPLADIELSTRNIDMIANNEAARYVELVISNVGGGDTGKVTVSLPNVEWMSLYSGGTIENIASGESATVVLKVDPTKADILLNAPYEGSIAINSENGGSERVYYDVTFVDADKCSLTVQAIDIYSLQMTEKDIIANAKVRLFNAYTNECVATGYTDADGLVHFDELEAGAYYMYVDADNCDRYSTNLVLSPGENRTIEAYVANTTLEYTFTVTPSEIEDEYTITQTVDYVTNVPAAVVVFEDSVIEVPTLHYGESVVFNFTVSNYGLVAAQNYSLTLPDISDIKFEILNPITSLAAQSSHEFWVKVTAVADTENKSGVIGGQAEFADLVKQYWEDCGKKQNSATIKSGDYKINELWWIGISSFVDAIFPEIELPWGDTPITLPVVGPEWEKEPTEKTPVKVKVEEEACTPCQQQVVEALTQYLTYVGNSTAIISSMAKNGADILDMADIKGVDVEFWAEFAEGAITLGKDAYEDAQKPYELLVLDYQYRIKLLNGILDIVNGCLEDFDPTRPDFIWLHDVKDAAEDELEYAQLTLGRHIFRATTKYGVLADLVDLGVAISIGYKWIKEKVVEELVDGITSFFDDLITDFLESHNKWYGDLIDSYKDLVEKTENTDLDKIKGTSDTLDYIWSTDMKKELKDFLDTYEHTDYLKYYERVKEIRKFYGEFNKCVEKSSLIFDKITNGDKSAVDSLLINFVPDYITDEELAILEPMAETAGVDWSVFLEYVDKWNRTQDYYARGIIYEIDVPIGESVEFFSIDQLQAYAEQSAKLDEKMEEVGASSPDEMMDITSSTLFDKILTGESEVCARVKLQFTQTATMSREAFDGMFTLSNGSSMGDMTDIHFSVWVQDMNGVDVSEYFNITYYDVEGFDSLTGGTLGTGEYGEVAIRYIPSADIAAEGSEQYRFGATLTYTDPSDGESKTLNITPVTLTVNPSPNLQLHYFLTENVYADDPFSAEIEAAQKAEIGLLVTNTGKGVAKNFTLTDFHPEFVENEQGLALELTMLGSSLNGGALQSTGTTLNFGNLEGGTTSGAVWYFRTNMHGYFENYEASFTRVDSLGNTAYMTNGTDVSLIESVETHLLTRSMDADGDGKTDFLVNDKEDARGMADGLYFGDGSYADVNGVTLVQSSTGTLGMGNMTITLNMYAEEGWNYFRISDPGAGNYRIEGISVGGVQLDADMFWQTDRVFAADGSATYIPRLHWLGEFTQAGYVDFTITYSSVDEKAPGVESISGVEDMSAVREAVETLTITFDEAVNTATFGLANMELRLENEVVDLTGLTWEWVDAKTLRLTNLADYTKANGAYSFRVLNGGVEDIYGNAGDGSGRQVAWTHVTKRVAVQYVEGHTNRKLNKSVDALMVTFTEAVAYFSEDAVEVVHRAPDGTVTELSDLEGITITRMDNEGKMFLISGLESIQTYGDGYYALTVDSSKVVDAAGNVGMGNLPVSWELHQTPPSVVNRSFVLAEQTVQEIDTLTLHFSHAVSSLDLSKLTLTCNGEVYTSSALTYSIDAYDPTLVTVKGISKAVPAGKAATLPDGDWQLSVDMSGVEDIYGNIGEGTYSTDWQVDTVAPVALEGITLNGKESLIVADTTLTVGAALPEAGLTVSIYEKSPTANGLGTLLWSGVVEGDVLSREVTLLNGGTRTLTIVTTDAAGNATSNSYNVLVDMVVLTVATDLEARYKELPDAVLLTFNAGITELPLSALSLTVNGTAVSLEGATITRLSDSQWQLSGLQALGDTVGSYQLSVELSSLAKSLSGLAGSGSYTQSFMYDPVTEVEITGCELTSTVEKVTGLSISFSTAINYAALEETGLLSSAVRLVNQADGTVVLLDAAGFAYADKVLTWNGTQTLPGGTYALVVDAALLTAANGAPLVGNASTAETSIVDYKGDALLLGASGLSYSAPYAVDWNGDGYADLLVGEKSGSEGKVRLYLNNGSGGFSNFTYLQSNGADLSVSANGCQGIVVALQDITGDGVADLVAGLSNGTVQYYAGTASGGFGAAVELPDASVAGSRAYPVFTDWNGDGTVDLVLGTGAGTLMVGLGSKDAGTGALSFATPVAVAGIEVPGRAAPAFADVNGDGIADLLLGAGDGSLTLYYGSSTGYHKVGNWELPGVFWERSRITLADLNADGKADLIVGGSTGDVYVVYGANPSGSWAQAVEIEAGAAITATHTAVQGSDVTLSWTAEHTDSTTRYLLEVADNAAFANATVYSGLEASSLVLAAQPDGTYYWRVQILDSDKPALQGDSYMVDVTAPGAPEILSASVVDNTAVLSWAPQTDASGVVYELRYAAGLEGLSSASAIRTTETGLNLSGLPAGTWYWQVRAVDGMGNAGAWTTAEESFRIDEIVAPESTAGRYWAAGLLTSDGRLLGGYSDADKTGTDDSQMCWAAASANMLAWWQTQYGVANFSSSEVPATADAIFGTFIRNWANVSGREEYGLTWWISGNSENASYGSFYATHYTGSDAQGAYYAPHYDAAATSALVKEISLTGADAAQIARDWAAVYAAGGMMSLGVYSSMSGTTPMGGHTLTLWGFATDTNGRLTSITVTDSDDATEGAVTLNLVYNVTKGYYQVAQSGSRLNGLLLGDYTCLGAFDKADAENSAPEGAESITLTPPANGSTMSESPIRNWVGAGDTEDYYSFTASDVGIYHVCVDAAKLESSVWLSVGTLDAEGNFSVVKEALLLPNSPMTGVTGLRMEAGMQYYVRISTAEGAAGTSYDLYVQGDIDEASPVTDNNTMDKAWKLVKTNREDATVTSWVGAGDALDVYYFEVDETCTFNLLLGDLEKNAKVKLYYDNGDGTLGNYLTRTVRAASGLNYSETLEKGVYYLEIASYDNGGGRYNTSYTLELEKVVDGTATRLELASTSPITDNNTMDSATQLEMVSSADAVISSWVGAGDALDFYSFNVAQEGTLSLCLSELEKNTKVYLYQQDAEGNTMQAGYWSVRANRGLDTELQLEAGNYFLEIASYDNGAGRYNTTYALELEKEENGETKRYAIAGGGLG